MAANPTAAMSHRIVNRTLSSSIAHYNKVCSLIHTSQLLWLGRVGLDGKTRDGTSLTMLEQLPNWWGPERRKGSGRRQPPESPRSPSGGGSSSEAILRALDPREEGRED